MRVAPLGVVVLLAALSFHVPASADDVAALPAVSPDVTESSANSPVGTTADEPSSETSPPPALPTPAPSSLQTPVPPVASATPSATEALPPTSGTEVASPDTPQSTEETLRPTPTPSEPLSGTPSTPTLTPSSTPLESSPPTPIQPGGASSPPSTTEQPRPIFAVRPPVVGETPASPNVAFVGTPRPPLVITPLATTARPSPTTSRPSPTTTKPPPTTTKPPPTTTKPPPTTTKPPPTTTKPPPTTTKPPPTTPNPPPSTMEPPSPPPRVEPSPTPTSAAPPIVAPNPTPDTSPPLVTTSIPNSEPGDSSSPTTPDGTSATPNNAPAEGIAGYSNANTEAARTQTPSTSPSTTSPLTVQPTDAPLSYVRQRFNLSQTRDPQSSQEGEAPPNIIGGLDERRVDGQTSQQTTTSTGSTPVSRTYRVLQYVVSLCAAISVLLLIGFHSVAVDERYDWFEVACGPTTWEFFVYVGYIQHLASISQLVLVKTPPSLWKVLDGLSWSCLLPYHSSDSAVGVTAVTSASSTASRRLETILLSGMVAFADRVGVKETDLLGRTVTGLAVFACAFLLFFFVFAAFAKRRMDFQDDHPSRRCDTQEVARVVFWRTISMRVCSLLVLLWIFALYPLTAVSTYEVTMELRANALAADQLLLAVIAVLILCLGGLLLVGYTVSSRSKCELSEPFHLAAWGSLYADYMYDKRSFLVAPVLLQIVSGVIVGAGSSPMVQLALLLAVLVVFLLAIWVVRPFMPGSLAPWFVVVITLLKLTNVSIALAAFTVNNEWSGTARASAADAIVYLNLLVVVCWLLRLGAMLCQTVRYRHAVAVTMAVDPDAMTDTGMGHRRTLSFSVPPPFDTPQYDAHAGGFLDADSQRSSRYESQRSDSSRGMTSSLRSWKKHHLAMA